MALYQGKWDPELYRRDMQARRKAAVLRQERENAAELDAIDRALTGLESWLAAEGSP